MTNTPFPRLRDVLGADVEALSVADLQRAVGNKLQESFDLEFKEALFLPTDAGKHELAEDVAAMANTRGGLVVLGIKDANGRAEALKPVPLSEVEDRRMRSVIADLVFPQPDWDVHQIANPESAASGFYALVIRPSALKPHGVFIRFAVCMHTKLLTGYRSFWTVVVSVQKHCILYAVLAFSFQ